MATLLNELSNIISALENGGIEYAVCGGLALAIHGFARASYGFDFLIQADSIEQACDIVKQYGYDKTETDKLFEHSSFEVQIVSKVDEDGGILPIKFVAANSKIRDVWDTRETLIWQDKTLWIVSRDGLIKMKELAGRDKDLIDIGRLKDEGN